MVVVPTRASATFALITSARNENAMVDNRMSPSFPSDAYLTQMEATVIGWSGGKLASSSRRPDCGWRRNGGLKKDWTI